MSQQEALNAFIKHHKIKKDKYGRLVLYKAVMDNFGSWFQWCQGNHSPDAYKPGTEVNCRQWNTDPMEDCGSGLHVSTLEFAKSLDPMWASTVVEVRVCPEDVVCVPNGLIVPVPKIRVKRLYVSKVVERFNLFDWEKASQ